MLMKLRFFFPNAASWLGLVIVMLAVPLVDAVADSLTWTKASGGNLLWSNPLNWTNSSGANAVPTANDTVTFDYAVGVTNAPGLVNNIVGADMMVGPMLYRAQEPGYHTLLIQPGATLTFTNGFTAGGDPFSYRGALSDSTVTGYVTIQGQGRLVVGNTNSPHPAAGNMIRVHAVSSAGTPPPDGPFMATLDLSSLDYFASATGELKVGASGTSAKGTRGTLILAKTNLVIAGVATNNFYGIIIGSAVGGNYQPGGSIGDLRLGQVNDVRANAIRVGGPRAQLGTLRFRSGLDHPTVRMRNVDGVAAMGLISVGDNYQTSSTGGATSTPETSTGNADLSGGTVDILVASLRVGRNLNSSTTGNNGSGNGTLTWTAGTIICTGHADIGRQNGDNAGNCLGVVNVQSNAVLLVNGIRIGSDSGGGAGTGNGTLNIVQGGEVTVTNDLVEDITGSGVSTINLTNGSLAVGGLVTVDNVNAISGTISNAGLMTASVVTGNGLIAGPVTVLTRLAPGVSIGTLTNSNDLVLYNTSSSVMEVNLDTLACDKVVGLNSVTFGGALVVTNTGGMASATNGATLRLFSAATYLGAFAATNLPALGGGLDWDTSGLANGTLRIAPAGLIPPAPTNLTISVCSNALDLLWPADDAGWWLESQTNPPTVGLSTNWFPVPGSEATNHLAIPIDPANGTVFYRLARLPSMKELRQTAANRRRRLIFNNDGGEPARSMTEPTAENLLALRTLGLEDTLVDSLFYTPRCSGFGLFTYFTTIGSIFTATGASYTNNMMEPLLVAGIDPLRVMVDYCKQHGLEVFCSFRMNDTHDGAANADAPVIFNANPLKVNHPEYLIGTSSSKPKYGAWTAVDYGRPEIRELAFQFAQEVCTNYDVDGIELDFFRHPVFFKSTGSGAAATVAERTAMTQLMQRIRTMTDEVGYRRARPILIAMRVPDSVDYCRAIGLELDAWLATDLLDLLVVSGYFQLRDWDYSVALARQYGVKVYPSLDECRLSNTAAKALRTTDLAYRGRAANVWGFGADGVYMFNFTDPQSPLWRQMGEPEVLAGLDKDYFGSIRGAVNAAGGNLPYASYQTVERLNPSNTKTVAPGSTVTARLNVGEDLAQAGPMNLKLRLQFQTAVNPQLLQVFCNSQPLSLLSTNLTWVEYSVSPPVINQVTNQVKVILAPNATQAVWTDLMLQVRH